MKPICGIYKITSPSGKIYIGQSIDIYKNWHGRYKKLRCTSQILIFESLKKHGWDLHSIEVVKECLKEELNHFEEYYIAYYKSFNTENGMNLTSGGCRPEYSDQSKKKTSDYMKGRYPGEKNPFYGKKHSEETLAVIREKRKLQVFSEETIEKKRQQMIGNKRGVGNKNRVGKKHTEESKKKMSVTLTGKKRSKESIQKQFESRKGYSPSAETREKSRQSNLGQKRSEETKQNMKLAWIKRREKMKKKSP